MSRLKLLCALTAASLLLPGRSLVLAVPHPYPDAQAAGAGSSASGGIVDSSSSSNPTLGQIALQLPHVGLEGIGDSGLDVVGNITSGTNAAPGSSTSIPSTTALLAQRLNLTSHWQAPVPPSGSSVQSFEFIADKWQLWHNRLYGGQESNLHLVKDPFFTPGVTTGTTNADGSGTHSKDGGITTSNGVDRGNNSGGGGAMSVLQVDYQNGTYRQGGAHSEGGSTFFPYPMEMQQPSAASSVDNGNGASRGSRRVLLRYEVAFKNDFDFVKGGKLPGLFYGSEERDCSGGKQSDGKCFSVRMMWRENGLGEVYAYLPSGNNLCSGSTSNNNNSTSSNPSNKSLTSGPSNVICNSDYGTSLGRGKFSFSRGSYTPITMYVALNTAASIRDGIVQVWANDTLVVDLQDLLLSAESAQGDLSSLKIFFSTFFGGSTPDWASRQDTSTFFRNLEVYTDASPSSSQGGMKDALSGRYSAEKSHAPPSAHDRMQAMVVMIGYALAVLAALYL